MEASAARKEWRAVPDAPLRSNGAEVDSLPRPRGKTLPFPAVSPILLLLSRSPRSLLCGAGSRGTHEDGAIRGQGHVRGARVAACLLAATFLFLTTAMMLFLLIERFETDGAGGLDDCSIAIDGSGGLSEDIIQQRLQSIVRQREELQQVEMELRAQVIAHPQIIEAQRSFEAAAKEHVAAASKLKDDKDRELDALKIDHQTVWANQDLLREQTKELQTFRRERDNSEAERAQHLKQIHDLQEHLREKESQFLALEEQHRAAQDNIIYKDEQLREAHAWVARVQEMDVLQSQTLQAELHERNEQFNQYWISFQQQYVEMQRGFLHTIQQLQVELNELRERTGAQNDGSQTTQDSSAESAFGQNKGNIMTANGSGTADSCQSLKNNGIPDGSIKGNSNASAVPVVPSSLLGIGGFVPSAQIAGMHSYIMHPQGVPPSLASPNSAVPQFGNFQSQSTIQPNMQWPNQQETQNSSQTPDETNYQTSQSDQNAFQQAASNNDDLSLKQSQVIHAEHLTAHGKQPRFPSVVSESSHEQKAVESNVTEHLVYNEQQKSQDSSSVVSPIRKFEHQEQKKELKDGKVASGKQSEEQVARHQHKGSDFDASTAQIHLKNDTAEFNSNVVNQPDTLTSAGGGMGSVLPHVPNDPSLLDERSLLACIVRAVPSGPDGQIRISTTLPNRLGKMLAPLHWHDYKKHYGKLDDFVASHPEGMGDVTISNKVKDIQENGFSDEVRPMQSSVNSVSANGGRHERAGLSTSNIRHGYGGKQQGRSTGPAYISRR
ncbi:hypothetical protein ABZP36_029149 [Zizania latifolia]